MKNSLLNQVTRMDAFSTDYEDIKIMDKQTIRDRITIMENFMMEWWGMYHKAYCCALAGKDFEDITYEEWKEIFLLEEEYKNKSKQLCKKLWNLE